MTLELRLQNAIRAFLAPTNAETQPVGSSDLAARELAFYEACVNGWIQTRLEKDKSILTISSGGIAIIFAVLAQSTTLNSAAIYLYCASGSAFALSALIAVYIFQHNGRILENCISGSEQSSLDWLDNALGVIFAIAIVLIVVAGGMQAKLLIEKLHRQEIASLKTPDKAGPPPKLGQDSLAGIGRLAPAPAPKPAPIPPKPDAKKDKPK